MEVNARTITQAFICMQEKSNSCTPLRKHLWLSLPHHQKIRYGTLFLFKPLNNLCVKSHNVNHHSYYICPLKKENYGSERTHQMSNYWQWPGRIYSCNLCCKSRYETCNLPRSAARWTVNGHYRS